MFNRINKFQFTLALLILAAITTAVYKAGSTQASVSTGMVSVIVELRDDPAAVYKAKAQKAGQTVSIDALQSYRNQLKATQDQFLKDAQSAGANAQLKSVTIPDFSGNPAATVEYRYTLVYNGLAMTVPNASLSTLAGLPEVKAVHPSEALHLALNQAVPYIDAPALYGKNPNDLTPFANLPDGDEGQGVNIAVIDTGIDWTNPMFGGDPTPPRLGVAPATAAVNTNQKVIYYLPLAGLYDDFGHGSHCAGDAAGYLTVAPGDGQLTSATSGGVQIHGVAPAAKLMVYKAGTAVGLVLTEDSILSLEDAVSPVSLTMQPKPIANVINLSFGGGSSPDDPNSVAADNATLTGAVVVAAAGNSGPGDSTIGAPASGRHVIAVGATMHPGAGVNTADVMDGSRTGMVAGVMQGSPLVTSDIKQSYVYCGLGETPADFPSSVSGKIALIRRGSTVSTPPGLPTSAGTGLFTTKAANAAAAGAVAALIYNNEDGELNAATVRKSAIPTLGLSKANGEFLLSILGSNASGAVSAQQVRINKALQFTPDVASFSSRGPVDGLGQVKPDVSAPGVHVYSATVRVGGAETNTTSMFDPSGFIAGDGTSFATPITAGAAALIKQAHPDWSPDVVRTALINTATNMRDGNGTPKPDGLSANRIMEQGGGLIDVYKAAHVNALLGVTGDGIVQPSILGSYSFGAVPVINSRVTHTENTTVTIQDISGQGGTYNLSVANNRYLEMSGITATTSASSVTVPANGSATFTVSATVDGNIVRDTTSSLPMQFYVTAQNSGGSLRMPFYMQLTPTVPRGGSTLAPFSFSGTILVGDNDSMLVEGVDMQSFQVVADAPGAALDADLTGDQTVPGTFPDLDLYLYGPDGTLITQSTNGGLPDSISRTLGPAGTYILRVAGSLNANANFSLTGTISKAAAPPTLQPITGEFVDNQGNAIDFDGSYQLAWSAISGARKYEIEQSHDGTNYSVLADVDSSVTSQSLSGQADGQHFYRVRALTPGQIGYYVTPPSTAQSIIVNHRVLVDITDQVKTAISNVSLTGGVFSLDLAMTNQSTSAYVPFVKLNVIGVTSTLNTVRVTNADNGGSGVSPSNAALFDYSNKLGSDQLFSPAETTDTRTLKFSDSASEMFQFDVDVTAYLGNSSSGGGSSAAPSSGGGSGTQSSSGLSLPGINLQSVKGVMRITVNPLTKGVTAQFVLK